MPEQRKATPIYLVNQVMINGEKVDFDIERSDEGIVVTATRIVRLRGRLHK